ncbi:hypothetical protein L2E82_14089 [Cichorium intybus]|uniref:Uncharacterized protein n=1 Tax=Cichorium intybus TaxID=13427 RepID=A0ACB9EZU6_CICIN|nr:hypothetical protein L2E82_14089 [Cichorium intybus]
MDAATQTITDAITRGATMERGLSGTLGIVYCRNQKMSSSCNTIQRGRGIRTGSQSVLPYCYLRTPLGYIAHVARALTLLRLNGGTMMIDEIGGAALLDELRFFIPGLLRM